MNGHMRNTESPLHQAKATPVFVVGKHRSGTTWMANLLIEHPLIAGIHHQKHVGIHESAFFSRIKDRYGDLSDGINYAAFSRLVSSTDYFRLAQVDERFLADLFPSDYEIVFRAIMDRYAWMNGCSYWVEKTPEHTLWMKTIAKAYQDAKFIAVTRNVEEVIGSGLHMRTVSLVGVRRWYYITSEVIAWVYYNRTIDDFGRSHPSRLLVVNYRNLVDDREATLRRVSKFLGLVYDPAMLKSRYAANSSFEHGSRDRQRALHPSEKRRIEALAGIARTVPTPCLDLLYRANWYAKKRRPLPEWKFRLK